MGRLSLVVITRNRKQLLERNIDRHLASLPEGSEPGSVIVVDNGSTDGTAKWLDDLGQRVTVVALRHNVGPDARLIGAARARTRYVAFSDDDSWWEPGDLEAACDVLDDRPDVALASGATDVGPMARPDPLNSVLAASPLQRPDGETAVLGFMAFAAVVRRDALLSCGLSRLGMGSEEQLIAIDLASSGWSLIFRPELRTHHHPRQATDRGDRDVAAARNAVAIAMARRRGRGMTISAFRAFRRLEPRRRRLLLREVNGLWFWVGRNRRRVPSVVETELRAVESHGVGIDGG